MTATLFGSGTLLDERFAIVEAVGQGGMGTVFRARDLLRDEVVALKILSGRERAALQRFERERQLLQELSHPGIVRYIAHGVTTDGAPYLVMEWLDGEDLSRRL